MSLYLLAKKNKMKKKFREMNHVKGFQLNLTHTGRLISKCNTNPPSVSQQKCYGQYQKKKIREFVTNRADVLVKRMPNFHSSQHTANLASKTIQDQVCCPVKPTICKNDCPGILRNLPVITKDIGFKPASWQTDKVKSNRNCMCNPDKGKNEYDTPVFGNHPGPCR